jgi:hypothetical protein
MLLETIIESPTDSYIKAERYINDGSPSGFSVLHTTSEQTCPKSAIKYFPMKCIIFSEDIQMEDIGNGKKQYINNNCMYVHPDMQGEFLTANSDKLNIDNELLVAPTASGRTVFVPDKQIFIKLTYLGYLGRIVRHMNRNMITSACEVTKQLINASEAGKLNKAFSILREDYGRIAYIPKQLIKNDKIDLPVNNKGFYEWGVLFREFKPFPYADDEEYLIPFFSLFSYEYDPTTNLQVAPQDKPLLIQLYEKQEMSIDEFLLKDILFPVFSSYFDSLIHAGIELEAHAQNLLLTINKDYKVKRIVCRDFESAARDIPLMDYFGIKHSNLNSYKCNYIHNEMAYNIYPQYYINHSFMFDYKLGEYLVTPILDLAYKYEKFNYNSLVYEIKKFTNSYISILPKGYFPKEWCHYANINWEFEKKKREYIWSENPKYR